MKNKEQKIDSLLDKNVNEQLAGFDWDKLNAAISSRLDQVDQRQTSKIAYARIFKVAAGIAAAAAVVFIAVIIKPASLPEVKFESGRKAVVKFIETKGSALVKITPAADRSLAKVYIGSRLRKVASCDIKIIDQKGDLKERTEQPAWIIITMPEPVLADNGTNENSMSMICLF